MRFSTLSVNATIAALASMSLVSATPVPQAQGSSSNSSTSAAPTTTSSSTKIQVILYSDDQFHGNSQTITSDPSQCIILGNGAENSVTSFKIQTGNYCEFYDDKECPTINLAQENIIPHGWIWKNHDETNVGVGTNTWNDQINSYRCFPIPAGVDPTKMTTANVAH